MVYCGLSVFFLYLYICSHQLHKYLGYKWDSTYYSSAYVHVSVYCLKKELHHFLVNSRTCQHMCGDFLSSMYWVNGDGSSSYLSKGSLSITIGSQSTQEKRTTGCAERGGCRGMKKERFFSSIFVDAFKGTTKCSDEGSNQEVLSRRVTFDSYWIGREKAAGDITALHWTQRHYDDNSNPCVSGWENKSILGTWYEVM